MSDYFDASSNRISDGTTARAADVNGLRDSVGAGFDYLPTPVEIKTGKVLYSTVGGTADAITLTMPYTPTAYADGMRIEFKAGANNTGAVTVNVDSLGVKSLVAQDGTALVADDLVSGVIYSAVYNSTSGKFHIAGIVDATLTAKVSYAEEWATKAEDSLISTAAGGDGATDYSALHHAAKGAASASAASASASAASASETAAAASETAAAASETAAAASEAAAAVSETNAAASAASAASAVSTHAALTATHGVSGALVGTTDSQTLTNKTITTAGNTLTLVASAVADNLISMDANGEAQDSGYAPGNFKLRKNLFVNGDFVINQDSTSYTPTSWDYINDMWMGYCATAACTFSQATYGTHGRNRMQIAGNASNTDLSVLQRVHAQNSRAAYLDGQVTVSGWIYSPSAKTLTVSIYSPSAYNDFSTTTSRDSDATTSLGSAAWTYFSVTLDCSNAEFANGMEVRFNFGSHTSGNIYMTDMQAEVGAVATDFEIEKIESVFAQCSRYYQKYNSGQYIGTASCNGTTQHLITMPFRYPMDSAPTATVSATNALTLTSAFGATSAITVTATSVQSAMFTVTSGSGSIGQASQVSITSGGNWIELDSRL